MTSYKGPTLRRLGDAAAVILLLAIVALVFARWLLAASALYWGDIGLYFLPMARFLQLQLARGTIPLWNPEILCGTPYVGNPQTWPYYPSILLLPVLGAARYLIVDDVLHIALAGLFMYMLLRRKRDPFTLGPALLGAIAYMLGGVLTTKSQFPNMLQAMAWAPAVLLAAGAVARRPGPWPAAGLAVSVALQILSGNAQVFLMTAYLALGYVILLRRVSETHPLPAFPKPLPTSPKGEEPLPASPKGEGISGGSGLMEGDELEPPRWRYDPGWLVWSLAGCFAGLAIAACAWLPDSDLWRHADRQMLGLHTANRFYLPVNQLGNFVLPYLHGSPYFGNFRAHGNFWETACYLGLVPAALALIGIWRALRQRRVAREPVFWLGALVLAVWLALGRAGGLFVAAFYLAPGIRAFHDPARLLLPAAVSSSVLCAYGMRWVLARVRSELWRGALILVLALLAAIDLGYFDRHLYPVAPAYLVERAPLAPRDSPFQFRRIMADAGHSWGYYVSYRTFHIEDRAFLYRLYATDIPNLPMMGNIPEASGYEPVAPEECMRRLSTLRLDALSRMSVEYITTYQEGPLTSPLLRMLTAKPAPAPGLWVTRYRLLSALPRARYHLIEDPLGPAVWREAWILTDRPDMFAAEIPPSTKGAIFVLADTAYPGWQASLDGLPAKFWSTSDQFRALRVPPSIQPTLITMTYRPGCIVLGLYLTMIGLAVTAAMLAASAFGSRRVKLAPRNDEVIRLADSVRSF